MLEYTKTNARVGWSAVLVRDPGVTALRLDHDGGHRAQHLVDGHRALARSAKLDALVFVYCLIEKRNRIELCHDKM